MTIMKMRNPSLQKAFGATLRLLFSGALLVWAGCATNHSPLPLRYDKEGAPFSIKDLSASPNATIGIIGSIRSITSLRAIFNPGLEPMRL